MDYSQLVTEQIDAGREFAAQFDATCRPLKAVFWLKNDEESPWRLYLASDEIDDNSFDVAYGEVHRLLHQSDHRWLDPFQIRVIGTEDRIAAAVLDILHRYPGSLDTRLHNLRSGSLSVNDAYIYAFPTAVGL